VPNNGIDEDDLFGDFVFDPDFLNGDHANTITSKKHVVTVILESARADLIGKKINGRYVSPNLNKLASEGSSFLKCIVIQVLHHPHCLFYFLGNPVNIHQDIPYLENLMKLVIE
jgi:hypothetical protein